MGSPYGKRAGKHGKAGRLRGIRARITLVTVVVSLVAMAGVVGLTAWASQAAMEEIISRSLVERLDTAEGLVARGEYQQAIDHSGIELLQVIDADGHVIASTPNVAGYQAIFGDDDDDRFEVDDLELDEDDDADGDEDDARAEAAGGAAASAQAESVRADRDDDDADDDDDDADDRDDDGKAASTAPAAPKSPSGNASTQAKPSTGNTQANQKPAPAAHDDDDDDDDDGDADEKKAKPAAPKASSTTASAPKKPAPAAPAKRSGDDDDDDDGDDDRDDDDDDDGDDEDDEDEGKSKGKAGKAKKLGVLPGWLFTHQALAAGLNDVHSIEVSAVLNTPGPFLVIKRSVDSPDGTVTLAAMTSLHPAMETAVRTTQIVAGLLLALLVMAGFFAYHMTGRTLRPVEGMRREVEAISAKDLSGRITPPAGDPDLSTLADTFNGLLSRIEASVNEQKRFISDASHELKSPIASTNLMLETLRQHPETVEPDEVLADLAAENDRLGLIVNDLLMLARQDEDRLAANPTPVDFMDLLYEEAASLRQRFPISVDDSGVKPVIGRTDANLLSHAVRNLLDNAARYAKRTVWVSCAEVEGSRGKCMRIVVSDDGPGIPEADRERVFGRFVRLEEGRERKKGSTGLGLSVARGNVERLGGTVRFAEPEHGGATAVIELPASAPSA